MKNTRSGINTIVWGNVSRAIIGLSLLALAVGVWTVLWVPPSIY